MANVDHSLVSVIVTNYNYARFLEECIQSVRAQTYTNLEIIVVDDGSTDSSLEIISQQASQDPRVRLAAKKNGGQASAFNLGFALSEGEIICFLDSDDYWLPDKVEKTVHAFGRGNHSVVQHNHYVVGADSKRTGAIHPGVHFTGDALEGYFTENHVGFFSTTSGISCRRNDLNRIFPLDEDWRICADVPLTRPLPLFGQVSTFDEPLGCYRIHGTNTWMHSEKQSEWIANQLEYAEYTNRVLAEFGVRKRVDFRKSQIYQRLRRDQLPFYHPQRAATSVVRTIRSIIPTRARCFIKHHLTQLGLGIQGKVRSRR